MPTTKPLWRNTLQKNTAFGHILDLVEIASELGYPYILWNQRIYSVYQDEDGNINAVDTDLNIDDLE